MAAKAAKGRPLVVAALATALGGIVPDASGAGVAYTYDAAGNRTSQTNATPPAPAWGSGNWGCFVWTP